MKKKKVITKSVNLKKGDRVETIKKIVISDTETTIKKGSRGKITWTTDGEAWVRMKYSKTEYLIPVNEIKKYR